MTASNNGAPKASLWLHNPQRSRLRRLILQVHLWTALITGIYIVLISLTGSAVVMRREFSRWFSPPRFVEVGETRLTEGQLRDTAADAYPSYAVDEIVMLDDERLPASVRMSLRDTQIERRFDPYTGADLGDPFPPVLQAVEWLVDLHDNLLSGQMGRKVNGFGGMALLIIVLTGAVLWWPGKSRWLRSLYVSPGVKGYRFIWRLHSSLGFWTSCLLLIWSVTAIYFAFPNPVEELIDRFDPDPNDFERPGEGVVLTLIAGHFGRFGALPVRFIWITLGLVPIALFVTGFLLWWKRKQTKN